MQDNPQFREKWRELNNNQKKYVIARQKFSQKKKAAEHVGLSAQTVYNWPDRVEWCVEAWEENRFDIAQSRMYEAWQLALEKLFDFVENVEDADEYFKLLKFLTERFQGKATQQTDVRLDHNIEVNDEDIDEEMDKLFGRADQL
jgi:hypothetical protein